MTDHDPNSKPDGDPSPDARPLAGDRVEPGEAPAGPAFEWRPIVADRADVHVTSGSHAYPLPESFEQAREPVEPREPRRRLDDPWAHRRAEPRLFAFLWTMYLLAAVVGSLMWVARASVLSSSAYGSAARTMMLVIAVGATGLWPMVRLSQLRPAGALVPQMLADWFIVVFPVQLVVWPLVYLAGWPVDAVGAVSLMLAVWPALAGAVVAMTQVLARRVSRSAAAPIPAMLGMLVVLGLMLVGPVWLVVSQALESNVRGRSWMLSPLTHLFRLTGSGLHAPSARVAVIDFVVLGGIGGIAVLVCVVAAALDVPRKEVVHVQAGGLPSST
ncbi:MAG: hypothetical protein AB7G11_03630 [Phycisphaerales bacterium]